MKKKNILLIISIALIIVIILFALIFSKKDMVQEKMLKEEISNLTNKDITKDRYNTKIKTKGDYAIVEKTIKKYKDEYAVNYQSILKMITDDKLLNMLSATNYKEDGPDFTKSKDYIKNTRDDFNKKIKKLKNMSSKNFIMDRIDNKNLSSYYIDLYEELMISSTTTSDLKKMNKTLDSTSKKINNRLDIEEEVLDLLIKNKGKWSVSDDKIVFKDTSVLNAYNELIKQVN